MTIIEVVVTGSVVLTDTDTNYTRGLYLRHAMYSYPV